MKIIVFIIASLLAISSNGQTTRVKVSLQGLKSIEGLFLWESNRLYKVPRNKTVDIPVDNLPTILYLATNRRGKIKVQRLLWVETNEISLSGSLPNQIMLSPLAKEQSMADAVLVSQGKVDQDSELFVSRPYIVYLSRELSRHDEDSLQVLLNKIPGETKSFWATKKIEEYLNQLQSVGFNTTTNQFKYLVAKNKKNEEQEFRHNSHKLLLVDFSASVCLPCIKDIKKLRQLNNKYGKQVELLSLWDDPKHELWLNVARKQKKMINWTSLRDETGAIFKAFNIKEYPTYMLFAPTGKHIKTFIGANHNLERSIKQYLKITF